jgi:hypothetical protein
MISLCPHVGYPLAHIHVYMCSNRHPGGLGKEGPRGAHTGLTVAMGTVKSSAPAATVISLLLPITKRNINIIFYIGPS